MGWGKFNTANAHMITMEQEEGGGGRKFNRGNVHIIT